MKIERDGKIATREIEDIRGSVGWDQNLGRYKKAMKQTHSWYTIRQMNKLIAFARVVSDGSIYSFIVDLNVRPEFQNKSIGKRLMRHIVRDLKKEGIRWVILNWVSRDDHKLGPFYKKCGFDTKWLKAGVIRLHKY